MSALVSFHIDKIKKFTSLLIVIMLIIGLFHWLTPAIAENNFSLSDWVIHLVEKLNWQQEGNSQVFNTLLLLLFLSLATSIGLPRQIAALVAGINLGALIGVIIATIAATLGCLITFSVSRYLLSDKITLKYPKKLAKLSAFLGEQTFLKAIVIRILPLGSNFITNIIAGVSKVSMPAYVGGSFVGFIPQMIIFSLAGSGIRLGAQNELIASGVLFFVALLISAYLVKKHKKR
ncbi:MAG: VTT domain-containing protein [Colwellia sp.]|nr:VTT domain-containing protein [Colwellia sp.]